MGLLYKTFKYGALAYYHLFFKLNIYGLENIDKNTNYIVCANHINLQDPIVLGAILPFEAHFMAKKELFANPILASLLKRISVFPVDRDSNDLKAIKQALSILKSGQNLGIFPEGTRNRSTKPLPVKAGVAMLAVRTKTAVLPITLDSRYRFFSPIRVVIHAPVSYEAYYDKKVETGELERLSQDLMNNLYMNLKYYQ